MIKKIRLLLIGPFPPPIHGNSLANQILYDGLSKMELYDVGIVDTASVSDKIASDQGQNFSFRKALKFIKKYLKVSRIWKTEIVYITTGHTFYGVIKYAPFIIFSRFLKKRIIFHLHGNNLGREYSQLPIAKKKILKYLHSGADKYIVLSESLKTNYRYFTNDKNIFIANNCFQNSIIVKGIRKNTNYLSLLYMSNIMEEKGIFDFLDALEILESLNIKYTCTIAGSCDEKISDNFFRKVKNLGSSVQYVGVVSGEAKKRLFQESNVFVLPTYYQMEGQPISILEAMATKNIIVTTRHSGIPEIVNEKNGFFVQERSPESIAECLKYISENMSSLSHEMGGFNEYYAEKNFSESAFLQRMSEILS